MRAGRDTLTWAEQGPGERTLGFAMESGLVLVVGRKP